MHTPAPPQPTPQGPLQGTPWWDKDRHADRRIFLEARGKIKRAIRAWFEDQGFTEVETGQLQVSPGNETHLHGFATDRVWPDGQTQRFYLHTSPEFAAKKLLAAGETKIFEFARVFRNREAGPLHASEFTMLEWYRAGADWHQVIDDSLALLAVATQSLGTQAFFWRDAKVPIVVSSSPGFSPKAVDEMAVQPLVSACVAARLTSGVALISSPLSGEEPAKFASHGTDRVQLTLCKAEEKDQKSEVSDVLEDHLTRSSSSLEVNDGTNKQPLLIEGLSQGLNAMQLSDRGTRLTSGLVTPDEIALSPNRDQAISSGEIDQFQLEAYPIPALDDSRAPNVTRHQKLRSKPADTAKSMQDSWAEADQISADVQSSFLASNEFPLNSASVGNLQILNENMTIAGVQSRRLTLCVAFHKMAQIDLSANLDQPSGVRRDDLAQRATSTGIHVSADDTWSDIFSKVIVEKIEPFLGFDTPTILCEYPAEEAALARRSPNDPRVAERFELYVAGVELANGFGELTDPVEQRARFEADMNLKQTLYGERYPLDEDFLAALSHMPTSSGVAMGFDRLVMLATGARRIDDVLWTPSV